MSAFSTAAAVALKTVRAIAGATILYGRGNDGLTLTATLGATTFEFLDGDGISTRYESRDFIVDAAALDFGDGPTTPQPGDTIQIEIGGRQLTHKVFLPTDAPPWRYTDPERTSLRVHTKLTNETALTVP